MSIYSSLFTPPRPPPVRTVSVLYPDATQQHYPLSLFDHNQQQHQHAADGGGCPKSGAIDSGKGGGGSGKGGGGGIDADHPHPVLVSYVQSLVSFHHWASAPPDQRQALMTNMQTVADLGLQVTIAIATDFCHCYCY